MDDEVMFGLGTWEFLIVVAIVVTVFGVNRIPKLGGSFGEAISNFRLGLRSNREIGAEDRPQGKLSSRAD